MTTDQLRDLRDAIDAHLAGKPVEYSHRQYVEWQNCGDDPSFDDQLLWRPKPEPKTRPWAGPADVPLPVCWIRHENTIRLVIAVGQHGFSLGGGGGLTWSQVSSYEYSTDGRNFSPCVVTEP